MPLHWVGFLRRFGLKMGLIHFAHFGLESGMVFEGTTECMNVSEIGSRFEELAPVVRKVDSAIHWINHYPLDSATDCRNT